MKSFDSELTSILEDYAEELDDSLPAAIEEARNHYISKLKIFAAARNWPKYKNNFTYKRYQGKSNVKKAFHLVDYVGNSTKTKDNLPLSNILENGAIRKNRGIMPAIPHFRPVFDQEEENLLKIIEKKLGGN